MLRLSRSAPLLALAAITLALAHSPVADATAEKQAEKKPLEWVADLKSPTQGDRNRATAAPHGHPTTIAAGGAWEGNRCQPTLLTGVTEDMTVCKTETFGPVTSISARSIASACFASSRPFWPSVW